MHSEKKHTHWKNIKGMAEMEAVGMMAELQQIQRNRMITFIPQIAFFAFMAVTCTACLIMPVSADDIFDIAKSSMQNVYKDVAGMWYVPLCACF